MEKTVSKRRKIGETSNCNQKSIISESSITMDMMINDYFSRLPDSVVTHIFYFLSMQEAIGTCMLSKNLRRLRTSIPNLEFKDFSGVRSNDEVMEMIERVNKFLEPRDGPMKSCRLVLSAKSYMTHFSRWITILVERGIEELDLDLVQDTQMPIELPCCVFSSKTLRVLKLKFCILRPPSNFTGLSVLETLALRSMSISEDILCQILSRCSLLRCLTIQNCSSLKKVEIPASNTTLEYLTLGTCSSHISVYAPNVKHLYLRGEKLRFSVMEASSVVNVEISRTNQSDVDQNEANSLMNNVLLKLLDIPSLSLTGWAFKCFAASRHSEELPSRNTSMMKLELEVSSWNVRELEAMVCLFHSYTNVEKLILWMNDEIAEVDNRRGFSYNDDHDVDSFWEELDDNWFQFYGCTRHSVTCMEINNFSGLDTEVKLVKFLVANARVLYSLTITPVKDMDPHQQLGFANLFKRLPRPCIDTKIVVNRMNDEIAEVDNRRGFSYNDDHDVDSFWEELDDNWFLFYGCTRHSVTCMEINNFSGLDTEVNLVKFLVANARVLYSLTITPVKDMDPHRQLGFANLFKRLPRPCIDTKIVVNRVMSE